MDNVIEIYPTKAEIKRFIGNIYKKTKEIINDNDLDLWEKHNAYTIYCVVLLMYLTGHRPVRDPFWSVKYVDLDNGLILINDKVTDKKREFRLVALPALAVEQLREYKNYLNSLSIELKSYGKPGKALSAAVHSIDFPGKQKIPQFFLLDKNLEKTKSITSSVISRYTRDEGWLRPNFGRSLLASELLQRHRWAQRVEIQLGHMDTEMHVFGSVSEVVPKTILREIADEVNSVMTSLGWRVMSSFIKSRRSAVYDLNCSWFRKLKAHESDKFGDEYRKNVREEESKNYADLISSIFTKEGFEFRKGLTQSDVDHIVDVICQRAEQSSKSEVRCLRLFYKFLDKADKKHNFNFNIKRRFPITPEKSPFTKDTLAHFSEIKRLRLMFMDFCSAKAANGYMSTVEEKVAELILSAAIYGYVGDAGRLEDICDAVQTRSYFFNDEVFIDLKLYPKYKDEPENNVFRWYPDSVSASLISGLFEITGNDIPKINKRLVINELKKLLRALGFTYPTKDVYGRLSILVNSTMAVEFPGYLRNVASGDKKSASIPLSSYIRVISGKRLELVRESKGKMETLVSTCRFPVSRYAKSGTKKEIHYFIKAIRKAFTLAHAVDHNMHTNINTRKIKLLAENVNKVMGDGSNWSETSNVLASWLIDMCASGTTRNDDAAISTIYNYFFLVANAVMAEGYDKAIISLDESEFEDLFNDCLASNTRKDKSVFPRELRRFHGFMMQRWSVEDVDWSDIYSKAGLESVVFIPNANIVSEREYLEVINSILNEDLDTVRKRQYIVLMMLGYRFGLRFGEAFRVQWKNIQYDEQLQEIHVRVKRGFHGNPKTKAGIRRVTLITKLTRIENEALKYLLHVHKEGFIGDSQQGLMSDVGADRYLVDRAEANRYLINLIRYVSGDVTLCFHNLRHSWANEACLRDYSFESNRNNIEYEFVSQYADKDVISLRDAAVLIGHADEGTLLGSYIHKVDRIIYQYCKFISPCISARCLQHFASIKYDTARQRLIRNNGEVNFRVLKLHNKVRHPEVNLQSKAISLAANVKQDNEIPLVIVNEIILSSGGEFSNNRYRGRVDSIASRFSLKSKEVVAVLTAGAIVERRSGYEIFSLGQFDKEPMDTTGHEKIWSNPRNIEGEKRVRRLLFKVKNYLNKCSEQDLDVMRKGIDIWSESYCNADNGVYVTEYKDITVYDEAVRLIGFNRLKSDIAVPIEYPEKYKYIKSMFGDKCNVSTSKIRNASKKTMAERKSRVRMSVLTKDTEVVTKQTFNRVMFCLATWQLFRERSGLISAV